MQLIEASKAQLEAKLAGKAGGSQIVSLQERGRPMKLDSSGSWVPGLSGQDPNGTDDITGVRTARDLDNSDDYQARITAFLKDQQSLYRQAIAHIDNYLANFQKAKVNKSGNTEPARRISDNDKSPHPGPRGDAFRTPELLRGTIERMRHPGRQKKKSYSLRKS